MRHKLNIVAIHGSASEASSNFAILRHMQENGLQEHRVTIYEDLSLLPPFRTAFTDIDTPESIRELREAIDQADGVIFCSPEYVFSIPSCVKNLIEWCVSTVIFTDKPLALITASANGEKAHEEMQLIMRTLQAKFNRETTLLIQGVRGKVNAQGEVSDREVMAQLDRLSMAFAALMSGSGKPEKECAWPMAEAKQ